MASLTTILNQRLTIRRLLAVSWLLRAGLIVYGEWQDRVMAVKFTDIDYRVFSDAAMHVLEGSSPYFRPTYRYTPIIAWLLVPNHILYLAFGKTLFITLDVYAGWIIYKILTLQNLPKHLKILSCIFWLFNPLTAVVSSRGNAESTMAVLMLLCIYYLECGQLIVGALLYGMAVHVKIYPVIYSISLFLTVDKTPWKRDLKTQKYTIDWSALVSVKRVKFLAVSFSTFFIVTTLCYWCYGWEFIQETYLYHITRTDIRHNFSIYFYMLYLTQETWVAPLVSLAAFLPQLVLIPTTAICLFRDLPFCCFVQTFLFVTFNKVCTSQVSIYFTTCFIQHKTIISHIYCCSY